MPPDSTCGCVICDARCPRGPARPAMLSVLSPIALSIVLWRFGDQPTERIAVAGDRLVDGL